MDRKYAELTVHVLVSQYVKVEAAANESSRSLKSTASFLLSKWVLFTRANKGGHGDPPPQGKRQDGRKMS